MLGCCHAEGWGVPKNYQEAQRLFALASAQGHSEATEYLDRMNKLTAYLNQINEDIQRDCPLLEQQVVITGTRRDDLNGLVGVAASFDHERGRYVVELDGKGKNKPEKLKIKPGNLAKLAKKGNKGNKGKAK